MADGGQNGYWRICPGLCRKRVGRVAMNFYWVIRSVKIKIQWKNWFLTSVSFRRGGWLLFLAGFFRLEQAGWTQTPALVFSICIALGVFMICLSFWGSIFSDISKLCLTTNYGNWPAVVIILLSEKDPFP